MVLLTFRSALYFVAITAMYCTSANQMASAQCSGLSGNFLLNNENSEGHSINNTVDGGYIIGAVSSALNPNLSDWLIVRTDDSFNPLWSKSIGFDNTSENGSNFVVRELADGRIVAIGYQLQGGSRRGTIMVLSSAGDLIQSVRLPATNSTPRDIIGLEDGGIVVCGTVSGGGGASDDAFVLKISNSLDLLWYRRFNANSGPNDHFYAVIQGSNGNLFLVGGSQVFNSTHSGYLVEMDQAGVVVNERRYSNNSVMQFLCIREAADGGFLVGGHQNIGNISEGLIFRLNPDFSVSWNVSVRQGNKTFFHL